MDKTIQKIIKPFNVCSLTWVIYKIDRVNYKIIILLIITIIIWSKNRIKSRSVSSTGWYHPLKTRGYIFWESGPLRGNFSKLSVFLFWVQKSLDRLTMRPLWRAAPYASKKWLTSWQGYWDNHVLYMGEQCGHSQPTGRLQQELTTRNRKYLHIQGRIGTCLVCSCAIDLQMWEYDRECLA